MTWQTPFHPLTVAQYEQLSMPERQCYFARKEVVRACQHQIHLRLAMAKKSLARFK